MRENNSKGFGQYLGDRDQVRVLVIKVGKELRTRLKRRLRDLGLIARLRNRIYLYRKSKSNDIKFCIVWYTVTGTILEVLIYIVLIHEISVNWKLLRSVLHSVIYFVILQFKIVFYTLLAFLLSLFERGVGEFLGSLHYVKISFLRHVKTFSQLFCGTLFVLSLTEGLIAGLRAASYENPREVLFYIKTCLFYIKISLLDRFKPFFQLFRPLFQFFEFLFHFSRNWLRCYLQRLLKDFENDKKNGTII